MNREIKFRAWDENNKMTTFDLSYDIISSGINGSCYLQQAIRDGLSYKLMQYTGLKDKSGKEIYEGDIIDNGIMKWEVEFLNGAFIVQSVLSSMPGTFHLKGLKGKVTVIGNIHENKDLLDD